jgi:hypothetical protein
MLSYLLSKYPAFEVLMRGGIVACDLGEVILFQLPRHLNET